MTTPISKTARVATITYNKQLATTEVTAATAVVAALTSLTPDAERYAANRRLAIAKQKLDQETQALIQANQLP